MLRISLLLAFIVLAPKASHAQATTRCVPDPYSTPPGGVTCKTTTAAPRSTGSILQGIIAARIAYREGRSRGPTMEQLLRFPAVSVPMRRAAADSLGLVGRSREAYWNEATDAMVELFKVYPDAGPDVMHLLLDPITQRHAAQRK